MHAITDPATGQRLTLEELRDFRDQLSEIHRVARQRRLFGQPDIILEIAAETLSDRLRRMEREARG